MSIQKKLWLAVIALAVIGGGLWFALRPPAGASRAVASADVAAPSPARATTSAVAGSSAPTVAAPASAPKPADDALCIVKAPPPPRIASDATSDSPFVQVDAAPAPGAALVASRQRVMARLRASADPYANAVAVWLDVPGDEDVDGRLLAERDRQLAAMAASTRDSRLYALALRACWHASGRDCHGLSARRWAALDPDNAMPWTLLFDEAAAHVDPSGMQEAMHHIAQSKRIDEREDAPLGAIIDAAAGDDADLAAALAMSTDAIGIAAAQVGPAAITACRYATPANANVWPQCLAMRDLLENHSDSVVLRMAGASIDKRLTGNAEPLARVDAQIDRLAVAFPGSATGCRDLRRQVDFLRRAAEIGPIDALDAAAY